MCRIRKAEHGLRCTATSYGLRSTFAGLRLTTGGTSVFYHPSLRVFVDRGLNRAVRFPLALD